MEDSKTISIDNHPRLFLEPYIITNICHIGEGTNCCRYLAAGQHGFACLKLMDGMIAKIEKLLPTMIAKADHCKGIQMLTGHIISRN